jgi:hypothetical protein
MYTRYLSTELVESLGSIGAEGFLDLLSNHIEDLSEVLPGGAHLTPRLVHQDNAVCVELLPIKINVTSHGLADIISSEQKIKHCKAVE